MADLTQDFVAQIREAGARQTPLRLEGSGSKHWYGNRTPEATVLRIAGHTGIVDYDPAELVLTARAGTRLTELEAALAAQGQMLAFEPPCYGADTTLGGVVAAGLSGPSRPYAGGVRDFVLGLHLIDGRGDVLRFGGQVMKNVAGYDVSRLMTGALGVLGLITQVSLKVLPLPLAETTLCFDMSEATAMHQINVWAGQPLPITASAWYQGMLYVRFAGAQAAVAAATLQLSGVALATDAADRFWQSLRNQTHSFYAASSEAPENAVLWRLSLPATAPVISPSILSGVGHSLIEWGGAQRWVWSAAAPEAVWRIARELGGHAVLYRNSQAQGDVFDALNPALAAIHRRLKQTFDPHGIFNPGRLYRGL